MKKGTRNKILSLILVIAIIFTSTLLHIKSQAKKISDVIFFDFKTEQFCVNSTMKAKNDICVDIELQVTNVDSKNILDWGIIFQSNYEIKGKNNTEIRSLDDGIYIASCVDNKVLLPNNYKNLEISIIYDNDIEELEFNFNSFILIDNNDIDYHKVFEEDYDEDGLKNIEELCVKTNAYQYSTFKSSESDYSYLVSKANKIVKKEPSIEKAGGTYVVKKAIKWAIKHIDDIIEKVGELMGKKYAKLLARNSNVLIKSLNKLLEYEELAFKTVQDQVRNALTPVVGYAAATTIALGVRLVLEVIV